MEPYAAIDDERMSAPRPMTVEEQFMNLPEHTQAELIGGKIYYFPDCHTMIHQEVCGEISAQLWSYLRGKRCEGLYGVDVQLEEDCTDVLAPDIVVVCDPNKLRDNIRVRGVPDMIVEVLSPSTYRHDVVFKLRRYQDAGVREYWIVYPEDRFVHVYILENGQYYVAPYDETAKIKVAILDDCVIDLNLVFQNM